MTGVNRALIGSSVADLDITDYQRAWAMFAAGHDFKTISDTLGLTSRQLQSLYRDGLPKDDQPGFRTRLALEQTAIRTAAIEAAKAVSSRGVEVLKKSMDQAEQAQRIIGLIQGQLEEELEENRKKPPSERTPMADLIPTDRVIRTLQVQARISANYGRVGRALRDIYGWRSADDHSAWRAIDVATSGGIGSKGPSSDADRGFGVKTAAEEMRRESMGDENNERLADDVMRQILTWTPEERLQFAKTGMEPRPAPKEADEPGEEDNPDDVLAAETR